MSDRKETTKHLTKLLKKYINPNRDTRIYTASEVTFDYATNNQIRVDFMRFKPVNNSIGGIESGDFYCYEIKSCKEDFKSGHGLNFIGDFNYIVMPLDLYEECKTYIPYYVGVYVPEINGWDEYKFETLKCVKKAKKTTRKYACSEMLLMMFRSANRELVNIEKRKEKNNEI